MLNDRLASVLRFVQIADGFKTIARQSWLTGETRQETDAEHCWHMALFALLLVDELDVEVDLAHVIALIIVHDLVEIYAGDAYAFDYVGEEQDAKERAAAERLFGVLLSDMGAKVMAWWREFEEGKTPEAQFARSLDRLQAFNQSILSGGRDWKEHAVSRSKTERRMKSARSFDPVITALADSLYETADREGFWPKRSR